MSRRRKTEINHEYVRAMAEAEAERREHPLTTLGGSGESRYVRFSAEQLDAILLPHGFRRRKLPGVFEFVYDAPVRFKSGRELPMLTRVYSSIDVNTGWTRDNGADSIKVILMDQYVREERQDRFPDGMPIKASEQRVFRTKNAFDNIKKRLRMLYYYADAHSCPHCGHVLQERKTREGKPFLGCIRYPLCKGAKDLAQVEGWETGEHPR